MNITCFYAHFRKIKPSGLKCNGYRPLDNAVCEEYGGTVDCLKKADANGNSWYAYAKKVIAYISQLKEINIKQTLMPFAKK